MDRRDHTPPSSDHPMAQFYQQNFSGQPMPPSGRPTFNNATLLPTHTSSVAPSSTTITNTAYHQLSPEGRVQKPVRRRSRASRRTPTTLLNTDTTNFRAMVQQFTGGPALPQYSAAAHNYQLMRFQQQEQANYLYGGDHGLLGRGGGGGANVEMNLAGGGRGGGGGVSVVEAPPAPPNRQGAANGNRDVNNNNNSNNNSYMF